MRFRGDNTRLSAVSIADLLVPGLTLSLAIVFTLSDRTGVAISAAHQAVSEQRVDGPMSSQSHALMAAESTSEIGHERYHGQPYLRTGQSLGLPGWGRLKNAEQLPDHPIYYRRKPQNAWGASNLIYYTVEVLKRVKREHPHVHRVAIGDISRRRGGHLKPHRSHRSGRDIDIGFYFRRRPPNYPRNFKHAWGNGADMAANWTMLLGFYDTAGKPGGVDRVFLDYWLQHIFYRWAQRRGVPKSVLRKMFQYPRGKRSPKGIIRHAPNHGHHIHVRFTCPRDDTTCGVRPDRR